MHPPNISAAPNRGAAHAWPCLPDPGLGSHARTIALPCMPVLAPHSVRPSSLLPFSLVLSIAQSSLHGQVVDEEATIQALVNMARRKQIERESNLGGGGLIKKARYIGGKPGPKAMR